MTDPGIPQSVADFLAEHVDSAEQLETLLHLFANPDRQWDAEAVSKAIFTVPQSAARTLETLERRRLLASSGGPRPTYSYAGAGETDARVRELAAVYRERRAAVIGFLYAQPRVDPVRSFADAFKLRKDG